MRDREEKLPVGEVTTLDIVPLSIPEKPPVGNRLVKLTGLEVVTFEDGVVDAVGIGVWIVTLIVLVNVCVSVTVELPKVSVQVVVQTEDELLAVDGEPGVLELDGAVTTSISLRLVVRQGFWQR